MKKAAAYQKATAFQRNKALKPLEQHGFSEISFFICGLEQSRRDLLQMILPIGEKNILCSVSFRQYRTKSVWRLCTPSACKFPVIFHKNAREYSKYSLRFLFHLTKNLTTHLSHNLCAVLPLLCDPAIHFCLTAEYKVQILISGKSLHRSRNFRQLAACRNLGIPHSLSRRRTGADLHRTAGL